MAWQGSDNVTWSDGRARARSGHAWLTRRHGTNVTKASPRMTASLAVGFVNACSQLPVNAPAYTAGQSGRPYCRAKSASSRPVSSKRNCGRIGPVLNLPLRHPVGELMLEEPLRAGLQCPVELGA